MRDAYKSVVMVQQEAWLAKINAGMVSVIDKAIREGDAAALIAVHDSIIGKPVDTFVSDSSKVLPWDSENGTKPTPTEDI
jgi:hypothetical protein